MWGAIACLFVSGFIVAIGTFYFMRHSKPLRANQHPCPKCGRRGSLMRIYGKKDCVRAEFTCKKRHDWSEVA